MAIKYFNIERLVHIGYGDYICFDDIVGVKLCGNRVDAVYAVGGHEFRIEMTLADFEAEIERAIKKTIADQNENLNDFQNELKSKINELKEASLFTKTDKISDAN